MKIKTRFFIQFLIAFILAFSAMGIQPTPARAASIIYVDANAAGTNNGSSWANAYNKLQDAMAAASSGDQIWVSAGIYYPDEGLSQTNDNRNSSFELVDDIEIYGGFAGTETLLSQRNVAANPTKLSGDIDKNDVNIDGNNIAETTTDIVGSNAYHVVHGGTATALTILDGFIITAGNANGGTFSTMNGGGLFNWSTNPTLQNITFSGNNAEAADFGYGGGVYNYNITSPIQFTNVIFTGNRAYNGGGMAGEPPTVITDSTFINNTATNVGGGLDIGSNGATLTNVTFSNNTAVGGGALGITLGNPTLTNVNFTNNTADSAGAVNVYFGNPEFINSTFENNTAATHYGGAIQLSQSSAIFRNTTFDNNTANLHGGGIYSGSSSSLTLANVTFTNNTANNTGGGIYSGGSSSAALTNVTFSDNSANTGGGLYALNGTITLKNTIIANSTDGGDCVRSSAAFAGSGNNLIETTGTNACDLVNGVDDNIIGSDPNLGTLTGSPAYFPLNTGSPAIDAGNDAACVAAPVSNTSQNGLSRPQGQHCDIGSFEFDPLPSVLSITRTSASPSNLSSVGFTVTFSESVTGVASGDFSLTAPGLTGTSITNVSGSGSVYTVTASTGTGIGSLRLDIPNTATITDMTGNSLTGLPYINGETYSIFENSAPTDLSLSSSTLAENLPAGATVGTFTTSDPDVGDTFTYALVSGSGSADNTAFAISGNSLVSAQPFNFLSKNSYTIRVKTTDNGGLSYEEAFTITISNIAAIFNDVPDSYWAVSYIERLYNAGITGGCTTSPLNYCPTSPVTRAQMAIFLEKGIHGSAFTPPDVASTFMDTAGHWAEDWIEALKNDGVTSGCGAGIYCPENAVTRAQMAIFLLKAKYGPSYAPPNVNPTFGDTAGHFAEDWIEQLAAEGITSGCGGGNYCPESTVTRDQMAVFLVKAFNLP